MTPHAVSSASHSAGSRNRDRGRPAIGLLTFIIASTLLGGCGLGVLGHRAPGLDSGPKSSEGSVQERIRETRAQAVAAPDEPYWPFRLGQIHLATDSVASAVAALEAALERDRFYAPALSMLSMLHYKAGRHEQAVALLEVARWNPDSFPGGVPVALLAGLALHYEALDRSDLARAVMAAMPRPDRGEAASTTLYLTLRGATPDSATRLASASVREHPGSAARQNNYGITRLRAGDPAAARRAFMKAIELDPSLPGPYYNLAILEKYYVLDDAAAARWFTLHWERSNDDPDGLAGVFGKREPKELAKKGE